MQPNVCTVRKVKDDMTGGKGDNGEDAPPRPQERLPSEILDIIKPALQMGGLTGMSGLIVGGFGGIIRSSTPVLFALASGIQWFTLGTTYWAARGAVFHAWGTDNITPRDKVTASAIAGGVGGTAGGLLRGPRSVIPGAIMFTLFGAAGQVLYNSADASKTASQIAAQKAAQTQGTEPKNSWLDSKWSPVKVLSDKEYEDMLREKLLVVNAEIALVDESIEALRVQEREMAAKRVESTPKKEDLKKEDPKKQ